MNPCSDDRRREAADPGTPAARLRALAGNPIRDTDRRVLEALAMNPSTPPDLLVRLIERVPAAFCRNPFAPFLALEDPRFFDGMSSWGVGALLRAPRAPGTLVAQIAAGAGTRDYRAVEAARLHVTQGEEIPGAEWVNRVRDYWWIYLEEDPVREY